MAVLRFILGGFESLITPTFILIVGLSIMIIRGVTKAFYRTACTTLERNKFFELVPGLQRMALAVSISFLLN